MTSETVFPDLSPEILARVHAIREGRTPIAVHLEVHRSSRSNRLTTRELEVLALIADGLTNSQIASTLGIGLRTVMTHVQSILRKTQTINRSHAVAHGFRHGDLV